MNRNEWRFLIDNLDFCRINACEPSNVRDDHVCNFDDAIFKWYKSASNLKQSKLLKVLKKIKKANSCESCDYCNDSLEELSVAIGLMNWNRIGNSISSEHCVLCKMNPFCCATLRITKPHGPNDILGILSKEVFDSSIGIDSDNLNFSDYEHMRLHCGIEIVKLLDFMWVPIHMQIAFLKKLKDSPIEDFTTRVKGSAELTYYDPLTMSYKVLDWLSETKDEMDYAECEIKSKYKKLKTQECDEKCANLYKEINGIKKEVSEKYYSLAKEEYRTERKKIQQRRKIELDEELQKNKRRGSSIDREDVTEEQKMRFCTKNL